MSIYIWLSLHTYGMYMYIYIIYIWLCTERLTGFSPRIQMLGRRLDAPVCQSQKIWYLYIYTYIYIYIRIVLYVWYVYNKCVWDIYDIYMTSQSRLNFIKSHQPEKFGHLRNFILLAIICGNSVFRSLWFTRCMICIQLDGKKARDRLGVFGSQNWKMWIPQMVEPMDI